MKYDDDKYTCQCGQYWDTCCLPFKFCPDCGAPVVKEGKEDDTCTNE